MWLWHRLEEARRTVAIKVIMISTSLSCNWGGCPPGSDIRYWHAVDKLLLTHLFHNSIVLVRPRRVKKKLTVNKRTELTQIRSGKSPSPPPFEFTWNKCISNELCCRKTLSKTYNFVNQNKKVPEDELREW